MRKQTLDDNVYTLALERIHRTYDLFDQVAVSFSGGKDSTAALMLTLQVAGERDRLPLDVVFFDEEAIARRDEQIESQAKQIDHLTQLLAVQTKTNAALTDRLHAIEDMRKLSWWKRIFRR